MLTDKTIKLITEFDCWEDTHYPIPNHQDTEMLWNIKDIKRYYPKLVLNLDEQKRLENVLSENPMSKNYEVVSDFILWVTHNCPITVDYRDDMVNLWEYEYYYLGRSIGTPYRNNSRDGVIFENDDRLQNPDIRLSFWDRHYKTEYFEKTLPHYVERLRLVLD